jgi:hypothetical protein
MPPQHARAADTPPRGGSPAAARCRAAPHGGHTRQPHTGTRSRTSTRAPQDAHCAPNLSAVVGGRGDGAAAAGDSTAIRGDAGVAVAITSACVAPAARASCATSAAHRSTADADDDAPPHNASLNAASNAARSVEPRVSAPTASSSGGSGTTSHGRLPRASTADALAPAPSSSSHTCALDVPAAFPSGVRPSPVLLSLASVLAPAASSAATTSACPPYAARCNGVAPQPDASTAAPAASSARTHSMCPPPAA